MSLKTVSVVVPCFNEEANVPLLYARVAAVFAALPHALELVLVNDGSRDTTEAVITQLAQQADVTMKDVKGMKLCTAAGSM